jgi:uncharacterized C2H2 Zn-finger protein
MEQYRCPRCRAEFSTAEQLDRHMKQHTGSPEERPERTPGAFRATDEAERSHGEESPSGYRCPRCGAEFSTREELDRHGRAQHLME